MIYQPFNIAVKKDSLTATEPFNFCQKGFDSNKIFINLINAPFYYSIDENDFLSNKNSGVVSGYIFSKYFLSYNCKRVKFQLNLQRTNAIECYYIDFDEIHKLRIDFYLTKTLYMARSKEEVFELIEQINSEISNKNEEFEKTTIVSFVKENKIKKLLYYVCYAYVRFASQTIENFKMHDNQLLTIIEACRVSLLEELNSYKGIIYQVETGEGKSCIIQIIAAILALMGKTVHIASANITLSIRDYTNSLAFFQQLGLSTAVLLHDNELPHIHDEQFYPNEFFGENLFQNSLRMNFSICGVNDSNEVTSTKADIIFSTFVNLENLYLKLVEMCPKYISKYYKDCHLLIDEADSILIDDIMNGTIISREIKSNSSEVLKYVYQSHIQNLPAEKILQEIKKEWPKCTDITIQNIEDMFTDIDLIHQNDFSNGRKYSIEEVKPKKEKSIYKLINKVNDVIKNGKKKFALINKPSDDQKNITYKQILPFDYENSGVLEPNKEFNGFIHQFIAIKEMLLNKEKNIIIKDQSINYLYISHPIFVKLYKKIVGFTGTIGGKYDKIIYREQYNLITKKIPRENPKNLTQYPIILCDSLKERNRKIVDEIIHFIKDDYPVLAIFKELYEITIIFNMLIKKGVNKIFIYDGKNGKIKPESFSGLKGAVSLGTNACGRGTDIKISSKPLHVIISYYSSNKRVMDQALGRTARQGQKGSTRIICLKQQFISPVYIYNIGKMDTFLNDFQFKSDMQIIFIENYKKNREWIFSTSITSQKLNDEIIEKMREVKININRLNACNYEFPICMSIPTFLSIQSQKIFSLYNCPNCIYTWMLFQRYVREMILESWSLFINKYDKKYYNKKSKNISYSDYMKSKISKLYKLIEEYLPYSDDPTDYKIIPTFMFIFDKVSEKYEKKNYEFFSSRFIKRI